MKRHQNLYGIPEARVILEVCYVSSRCQWFRGPRGDCCNQSVAVDIPREIRMRVLAWLGQVFEQTVETITIKVLLLDSIDSTIVRPESISFFGECDS